MQPEDAPATQRLAHESLSEAGTRYGWQMPELDDEGRARARTRHTHLQRTDPDGAWVAEAGGRIVGVALAMVRGPLWYLSLLAVERGLQARGVGSRLMDRALRTSRDCPAAMIMSSSDPKALRRYGRAGFDLLPGFDATGTVDRARLPVVAGVREGDWAADGERVDDLARRLRGAGYGPDLEPLSQVFRLLVADDGFVLLRDRGPKVLGAGDPATAQSLMWAALAHASGPVEVAPFTTAQQWGLQVALEAGLSVRPGTAMCTRGAVGPLTPYLPGGAYG